MKALTVLVIAALLIALIVAVIWLAYDNARLRRRIKGLDEPELWLPRSERRAHARKLLKREDEEYQQQMIARLTAAMQGKSPTLEGNER
jgi:hypothetical protein